MEHIFSLKFWVVVFMTSLSKIFLSVNFTSSEQKIDWKLMLGETVAGVTTAIVFGPWIISMSKEENSVISVLDVNGGKMAIYSVCVLTGHQFLKWMIKGNPNEMLKYFLPKNGR